MNIKRIVWVGGVLLAIYTSPAVAWQCRHGLPEPGDTASEVLRKCGQPDFIYPDARRAGARARADRWYYNPGPSGLLRVLRFEGGKLSAIDTGGYGFSHAARRCTPADLRQGMSVYELAARCGPPKNKRVIASGAAGSAHRRGVRAPRTEIWTYDFGSQYLVQKVTLVDAQVDRVTTVSRGGRH
ncbi:MAG: DUF2845 domain-containing protein [Gammaproteobacteria bacterium]